MKKTLIQTRRSFLSASACALGGLAGLRATAGVAQQPAGKAAPAIPTADTRLKFNPDGSVRRFLGNTVICHLQPQGTTRDAVERIAADLKRASFLHKIAILPAASFHMTVYPGANDQAREITGWPSDLPATASMEECNRVVGERMRAFHLECSLPIRMRVDEVKTVANPRATTLRMRGANDLEEAKIRKIRDRLVDVFRFQDHRHDEYGFHITLAYQLMPFTAAEQEEHQNILQRNVPRIAAAAPYFEFGNPEFCTFSDMYRFDIQVLLAT